MPEAREGYRLYSTSPRNRENSADGYRPHITLARKRSGAHVPVSSNAVGDRRYRRHYQEETLLYQLVEQHYPEFAELMRLQDRSLPAFVEREFEDFLKCGRLEYGFLRMRCNECHTEKLVAFSCKRRGFCPSCGARRMADAAALQKHRAPQGTFSIAVRSHLVARLAALIPRPGVNLTRYHGVFAPNSRWRV